MAYADPSQIREHEVKVRLNDAELALVDALVQYTGKQRAVLVRELVLEQARIDMGLESEAQSSAREGAAAALSGAGRVAA